MSLLPPTEKDLEMPVKMQLGRFRLADFSGNGGFAAVEKNRGRPQICPINMGKGPFNEGVGGICGANP